MVRFVCVSYGCNMGAQSDECLMAERCVVALTASYPYCLRKCVGMMCLRESHDVCLSIAIANNDDDEWALKMGKVKIHIDI